MTETQFLDRPEGRVAYDDSGGEGPLLVAAPGMGDRRQVYRHVVPKLVDVGIRVATMDLRGVGESSVGWSDFSDAAIGSDLLALIDELKAGPAFVVGNSLTAASAVIAATDAPDSVLGLGLLGPFVRDVPAKWWNKAAFRATLARPWGRSAWVAYYRKNMYPGTKPPDHAEYVAALSANLAEPGRYMSFKSLAFNSHAESGARLDRVTQPTLVVMGTADPDFPDPAAEARHLGETMGAEVVLADGSGHYPQADSPDVVAAALIELVGRSET